MAQIITFGTLGARAAIRDVGRVMDIPLREVDRVAKLIPNIPGKPVTIEQALQEVNDLKQIYDSTPYMHELIDTASQMVGVVRNAGTHAAGVVITDKPLIEYVPLHRPTGSASGESPIKTVTQFEMNVLEPLGLLKVDFLGLATLTIMARACDLISQRHGVRFNLENIPTDDPATYDLMGRGETAGVFQVEGSGMRRWLMEMKPTELNHVIAMVALFRPGPMDFIPGYNPPHAWGRSRTSWNILSRLKLRISPLAPRSPRGPVPAVPPSPKRRVPLRYGGRRGDINRRLVRMFPGRQTVMNLDERRRL